MLPPSPPMAGPLLAEAPLEPALLAPRMDAAALLAVDEPKKHNHEVKVEMKDEKSANRQADC